MFVAITVSTLGMWPIKSQSSFGAFSNATIQSMPEVPADMRWEPPWRKPGDCGPAALFVFMKLEGKQVTMDEITGLLPVTPEKGCSLEGIHRAAGKLGMPTEVRYVKPRDLSDVPPPFILHGITSIETGVGHFRVIVDYDPQKKNYAQIDTDENEFLWNPEGTILDGYSGYVLVHKCQAARMWDCWIGYCLILLGGGVLLIWVLRRN